MGIFLNSSVMFHLVKCILIRVGQRGPCSLDEPLGIHKGDLRYSNVSQQCGYPDEC